MGRICQVHPVGGTCFSRHPIPLGSPCLRAADSRPRLHVSAGARGRRLTSGWGLTGLPTWSSSSSIRGYACLLGPPSELIILPPPYWFARERWPPSPCPRTRTADDSRRAPPGLVYWQAATPAPGRHRHRSSVTPESSKKSAAGVRRRWPICRPLFRAGSQDRRGGRLPHHDSGPVPSPAT
jgi:hypothetical protein